MKKMFTTLFLATLIIAGMSMHSLNAQTEFPYFPDNEVASDITSVASELSDPSSSLLDLTGDFTIQVAGTAGTEIVISNSIIFYSFTPTVDGDVRFVKKNETVYVYENGTYFGTISKQSSEITFPEITDETATTSEFQLLQNASFETTGGLVDGSTSNYKFGEPWVTNVEIPASFGIRLATSADAVNGEYVVIWRGSGNNNYFAQPITDIKANTAYKVIVRQIAGANANANFLVGIGSTESGLEYASTTVRLGTGYDGAQSAVVSTPFEISDDFFFTFKNTPNNTASSGNDPLTQIDYIALVEGTPTTTAGILGATGKVYYVDGVFAPEILPDFEGGDFYNLTGYIVNPSFETGNFNGWTNNGLQTQTNDSPAGEGWAKDGNVYAERWTGAPNTLPASSITQTVTGIPNGVYKLLAAGHAIMQGDPNPTTGAYLFAGSEQTPLNVGGEYEVADIVVVDNTLTIGFKLEGTITANWAAVDNFRLHYLGVDLSAINSVLAEKVAEAQAILDGAENPAGYNKGELQAAIDNSDDIEQTEAALEAAINQLNAAISHFHEIVVANKALKDVLEFVATLDQTDYPGKPEFDMAIADAQSIYSSTDDKTAQDLKDAESALKSALQAYVLSQDRPANLTAMLANTRFDLEPVTFTENDGSPNGTALVGSRVFDIPGWNEELGGDWGRIVTTYYGISFDPIPDALNGSTPPATNKDGLTDGAALKLSGSWGSTVVVTQEVTLPAGQYEISFDIINMSPGLAIGTNKFGFAPNEGDAFYGSTLVFAEDWETETVSFYLEAETTGKISVGFQGESGGAGVNAKLYIDGVSLMYFGDPVTVTFNTDGGNVIDEVVIEKGETLVEPETPVKDGYSFEGWYVDDALTTPWDFETPVVEDITLFANWLYIADIAKLSDIKINGTSIEGFDADVLVYEIVLPAESVDVPQVEATAQIENAVVVVTPAEGLPGTTTIVVTALDGTTELTYTIEFSLEPTSNINDLYTNFINVYPTISNGSFTVETEGKESTVTVMDITGRVVSVQTGYSVQTIKIDRPGAYLLKIESSETVKVVKVIKSN